MPSAEDWNRVVFKVPFNANHFMIVRFYDSMRIFFMPTLVPMWLYDEIDKETKLTKS